MRAMWRKKLDPDRVEEYVEAHGDPWPELIEEIRRAGVRNYSIFVEGDEAFGYLEHDDLAALDAANSTVSEVMARWSEKMRPLGADPHEPDAGTVQMRREVFHCD